MPLGVCGPSSHPDSAGTCAWSWLIGVLLEQRACRDAPKRHPRLPLDQLWIAEIRQAIPHSGGNGSDKVARKTPPGPSPRRSSGGPIHPFVIRTPFPARVRFPCLSQSTEHSPRLCLLPTHACCSSYTLSLPFHEQIAGTRQTPVRSPWPSAPQIRANTCSPALCPDVSRTAVDGRDFCPWQPPTRANRMLWTCVRETMEESSNSHSER